MPTSNIHDMYSFLRKAGNNTENDSSTKWGLYKSVYITDFTSPSNDVFHIWKNDAKLTEIVLPQKIEEEVKNIVFEQNDQVFFTNIWLMPTNKILFYGEPGCGKTMLTHILASMLGRELKVVNLSKLVSSHLGETSNNIANIFSKYGNKGHLLFIDEFDIIWRLRGDTNNDHNEMKRIVNTLLQLIDFLPTDAFLVFATNSLEVIDKALLRRLDRIIEIPLPDTNATKKFLKMRLAKYSQFTDTLNYSLLTKKYRGKSFSDIQRELDKIIKSLIVKNRKNGTDIKITTGDLI